MYIKKILKALLCLVITTQLVGCASTTTVATDIVVLFTNDVHCTDDDGLTYALISQYKQDQIDIYGEENVTLVDNGDHLQGGIIGALSKGAWIVDIMNSVGYDIATVGNHELDYGVDNFIELATERAEYDYIASNFSTVDGDEMLPSYKIVEYGSRKVAFIGIMTPTTITAVNPAYLTDDDGNYLYDLYNDLTGEAFYEHVQSVIDEIRDDVDYIIAMGHLGLEVEGVYSSSALLANTNGIDVLLDGHSHEAYETTLLNSEGEEVLIAQCGTKGEYIGKLLIDTEGALTIELIETSSITEGEAYDAVLETIDTINEEYTALASEVIAYTDFDLIANDEDGTKLVRCQETNLGDLIADIYRETFDTDIAIVNGGGIRADIAAGEITYGDIISVHPFGNLLCVAEVTGQMILDALEMGASELPEASYGSFFQVSGLVFSIDTSIPSSVVVDELGNFVSVEGEYRVRDVYVEVDGELVPLDLEATYTVASTNYTIKYYGSGMTMFEDAELVMDEIVLDSEAIITYLSNIENIPDIYRDVQGRINIY